MQATPLVSVIIPCYNNNNEQYLRECFDSVVQQTYPHLELIVIDDGSTNGASELLERLKPEYNFILQKQINKGISGALNTGITKLAKGKYIAMMGSDDFWPRNKVELQVRFMEENAIAASCTRGYYVYDGEQSPPRPVKLFKQEDFSFSSLLWNNNINQISVMLRRDIFDDIGLFDENSAVEDWDMWLRITDKYEFRYIPEPLFYYRRHAQNLSNYFDKLYDSHKYIVGKWKGREGQRQSLNKVHLNGIHFFARDKKLRALKIAVTNFQCANTFSYWKGVLKIFVPVFLYPRR